MEKFYPAEVTDLNRIEYNGQPVLTTAQLAEKFECATQQLRQNFGNNRERFVEGKHFFKLDGDELRAFKRDSENFDFAPNLNILYLWTKRGAARHSKMLGTDIAWEIFELLEDTYFNQRTVKELPAVTDFERGRELAKLAPFEKNSFYQSKIIAKAANLILGENFLEIPTLRTQQLTLFY